MSISSAPAPTQPEVEVKVNLQPAFTGACLCRGIRFALLTVPEQVGNCFCADCQRNAGGPCQTSAICPLPSMEVHDPGHLTRIFLVHETGSGRPKEKHFCSACGCTLWSVTANRPGERVVRVGLLEGGMQRLIPRVELFASRRPGWMPPVEGAIQWPTTPPSL
ncbi:hypothetical protein CALCODRAFT_491218 [Calocera cornea HHB12733]|uniref:CENP-V/GFA domain-containing protein n=1 Tax=Calocera cornea HHB12733 TaxID=1353952 RepID=A0A165J5T8_9BASI|nr:hypothetical protein CALCODRAFT_491218 [Calocera cornea HHB12733]